MKYFLLFTLLLGCSTLKRDPASIDLKKIIKKYDLPALGYLISGVDETLALEVGGRRDIYKKALVTNEDRFHLGSNSKVITSTLFAFLIEEKYFTWSSRISDSVPYGYKLNSSFSNLKFLDLLRHRSGMETNAHKSLWSKLWQMEEENKSGELQRELLAKYYLQSSSQFKVGDYKYSNVGYSIVGFLLEKKMGIHFEQLIQKYIFDRLNMNTCSYGPKGINTPKGHKTVKGKRVSYHGGNPKVYSPAGRIRCSMEDWAKFARFHLSKYLSKDQRYQYFYEPPVGHYYSTGFVLRKNGHFSHEGNNTLNHAILNIDPIRRKIILIVTNDGDNDKGVKASRELFKLLVLDKKI